MVVVKILYNNDSGARLTYRLDENMYGTGYNNGIIIPQQSGEKATGMFYELDSIRTLCSRGEIPQHTGNSLGNSNPRILVCGLLSEEMAILTVKCPQVTGFQTGSGQTGFSQKGHESHTFCHSLF